MKAQDLIKLLKDIPEDAEILSPVDDLSGAASDFIIKPVSILYDAKGSGPDGAPHLIVSADTENAQSAYLLDCVWTKVYDFEMRKIMKSKA